MCSLTMSTNSLSMSIITADSTVLCCKASRKVAPSPPPQMATLRGLGCKVIAGWLMHSWKMCSSISDVWML